MFEIALDAFGLLFTVQGMTFLIIGVLIGSVIGVLPGLGGMVGMSLLLPFMYGMDPVSGLALLIGMLAVTATSDTFPSVMIGVPG